jgi:hypothetical protein
MDYKENDASNNFYIAACICATGCVYRATAWHCYEGYILPSHCLAWQEGQTYRHTDWWEWSMKHVIKMGSVALINI